MVTLREKRLSGCCIFAIDKINIIIMEHKDTKKQRAAQREKLCDFVSLCLVKNEFAHENHYTDHHPLLGYA